jgi:hypothetical protein
MNKKLCCETILEENPKKMNEQEILTSLRELKWAGRIDRRPVMGVTQFLCHFRFTTSLSSRRRGANAISVGRACPSEEGPG